MALLPGDLAPDYTLASMLDGQVENLTLSSLRGQYIMLLFYPVDYGYVALTEFYALKSLRPSLADLPCSVLAVSTAVSAVSLVSLVSGFFSLVSCVVSCGNFPMIEQPCQPPPLSGHRTWGSSQKAGRIL